MHHPAESSPLGKATEYVASYSPELLFPISRVDKWTELGLTADSLPYRGFDVWNCYELSWLNAKGKPCVAVAEFVVPAASPNIIESKSFKLYLNSLNQSRFDSSAALEAVLARDLSAAAGASVEVRVRALQAIEAEGVIGLPGLCIDDLDVALEHYDHPRPDVLEAHAQAEAVETSLHSHLLRSNCPVTGQPDWGSLVVEYRSNRLLRPESLLAYVVSFRQHADFHEQCVERMFLDLQRLLSPERLTVYARYVRRGGLDINPYRSTDEVRLDNRRLARQ